MDFYVEVDGQRHSKMLQYLAFEEGYGWPSSGKRIRHTEADHLVFETESKRVTFVNERSFVNERFCEDTKDSNLKKLENFKPEEFRNALNGNHPELQTDRRVVDLGGEDKVTIEKTSLEGEDGISIKKSSSTENLLEEALERGEFSFFNLHLSTKQAKELASKLQSLI